MNSRDEGRFHLGVLSNSKYFNCLFFLKRERKGVELGGIWENLEGENVGTVLASGEGLLAGGISVQRYRCKRLYAKTGIQDQS